MQGIQVAALRNRRVLLIPVVALAYAVSSFIELPDFVSRGIALLFFWVAMTA